MAGNQKIYKNSVRLQDAKDARRFLARVINAYDDGRIDTEKSRAFGYLIRTFVKTFEAQELQERVEELENLVGERYGDRS